MIGPGEGGAEPDVTHAPRRRPDSRSRDVNAVSLPASCPERNTGNADRRGGTAASGATLPPPAVRPSSDGVGFPARGDPKSPLCVLGANTMVPSVLHAPPRPYAAAASTRAGPPARSSRFKEPLAKKPSDSLSGDQNGYSAPGCRQRVRAGGNQGDGPRAATARGRPRQRIRGGGRRATARTAGSAPTTGVGVNPPPVGGKSRTRAAARGAFRPNPRAPPTWRAAPTSSASTSGSAIVRGRPEAAC